MDTQNKNIVAITIAKKKKKMGVNLRKHVQDLDAENC